MGGFEVGEGKTALAGTRPKQSSWGGRNKCRHQIEPERWAIIFFLLFGSMTDQRVADTHDIIFGTCILSYGLSFQATSNRLLTLPVSYTHLTLPTICSV